MSSPHPPTMHAMRSAFTSAETLTLSILNQSAGKLTAPERKALARRIAYELGTLIETDRVAEFMPDPPPDRPKVPPAS